MNIGFISPPEPKDNEGKDQAEKQPYSTPIDTSPQIRHFGFWGNLSLARKFLLAFGVLFILALLIAAVTLNGLNKTQAAYEEALAEGIEIRRLSQQLETSLLQARANEKSFLLNWRKEGFFTANKNYVTQYTKNIADMRTQLDQLATFEPELDVTATGSIAQVQYQTDIAALRQNVDLYEKSFYALVDAFQKKGFDDERTDLESKFRLIAGNMEVKFSEHAGPETGMEKLQATFFRIRLNEKDYLLSTDGNYINAIHTLTDQLKVQIEVSDQLSQTEKAELFAQVDEYVATIDALEELDKEIASYNKDLVIATSAVESLTAKIKDLGEQLAINSTDKARSNSTGTLATSMFSILAALVISILLAVTFSQQLTRPLILLTQIAQEISEGNFHMRALVSSSDEIGNLTHAINEMSVQLQNALRNLESRAQTLKEQAVQIELSSQQSIKRTRQLQTIAEIARFISVERDLKKLLPLITQTVSQEFGFYHVGVFLLDDSGRFAFLLAANSSGGQAMLQRHHNLEVGHVGIVGNVTATGTPRIASDTGKDAVYFNNPDLPETRSELALPLKIEDKVIGALDIQSKEVNAFSDDDVEALTTLADQVSIAIQNTRLFNQIERSLAESNALHRQYLQETWRKVSREEKLNGYRYSVAGAVPLEEAELDVEKDKQNGHEIDVPIILRGETIGTLSVQTSKNQNISTDQIDLIKAVADRVALSAENARLFDETTRRAERERIVSEIASKIGTSFQTESILRTTATELSQLLNDADIFINLRTTNKDKKDPE